MFVGNMKKFIVSESGFKRIKEMIISESYSDKVLVVKDHLDKSFMKAAFQNDNGKTVGIFYTLYNGLPTKKTNWKQDVLDNLENKYETIIKDKKERDGFLSQVLHDWYYDFPGLKNGTLSNYKWN